MRPSPLRALLALAVMILAGAAAFRAATAADEDAEIERVLDGEVRPFVTKYCFECHGRGESFGDLVLDRFPDLASVAADRATWLKVSDMLGARAMPPKKAPQPSEDEVRRVRDWIAKALKGRDCDGPRDPGPVTLRRLNRAEYDNTIRDLLGVDIRPAEAFPADDRGHGFDNNADVLTTSPLLVEKYLAAAEKALAAAVVLEDPYRRTTFRASGADTEPKPDPRTLSGDVRSLWSNGEISIRRALPVTADYAIRVRASATQAGPDSARMAIRADRRDLETVEVKGERTPRTYEVRARLEQGERWIGAAFVNDFYKPAKGAKEKTLDRNLHVEWIEVEGPFDAPPAPIPESHRRIFFCAPGPQLAEAECARRIVHRFASRAFRRPAADDEVERYLGLFRGARARKDPFEKSVVLALEAVLVSPHFLFRVERDPPAGAPRAVGPFELATRLSYFIWSSMPDDRLREAAEAGRLADPAALEAEVRRMLADPRARALVDGFAAQWLELRNLDSVAPDPARFPAFDEKLRASMRRETELFFEAVLREDRSILEFLDSDWTFLDETLARHYGVEGVTGPGFRRVPTRGTARGGVLTQASILTLTSNPTRTSPVKRGKWVLDEILGAPPPAPPPGVPPVEEGAEAEAARPLRERMIRHRTDPVCASCHARMDALGFAFETFDGIGAARERDGPFPVDATGELPDGAKVEGPAGLKALLLSRRAEFVRCFAEKLLTYALGRGLGPDDRCTVDDVAAATVRSNYRFQAAIAAVVRTEAFRTRRSAAGDRK